MTLLEQWIRLVIGGLDEEGQDLIEYALIVLFVVLVVVAVMPAVGQVLVDIYYSKVPEALGAP